MFTKLKLYAIAAGSIIVAFFLAFWAGKSKGAAEVKDEMNAEILDDVRIAKEVRNDVEILDDDGLAARAAEFMREADD